MHDDLGWDDVARIEVNALDLPGVAVEEGQSREYPYGDQLSHVLGYVGPVSETEAAAGDPLLPMPGFRIGKVGSRRATKSPLRGAAPHRWR
ncbi:MAG: hypothetical protein U1E33_04090 [Rhodospirillales bacterium]